MKRNFFFVLFLGSFILSFAQGTGYVSIQGKQFKDENGNDFYPMVMNYNIGRTTNNHPLGPFYAAPASSYGLSAEYECNSLPACTTQLAEHFDKIKAMGFNTIRVLDLAAVYYSTQPQSATSRNFAVYYDKNMMGSGQQTQTTIDRYDLASDFSDANSANLFSMIKTLLTVAQTKELKVILVCGSGYKDPVTHAPVMWQTYDQQAANDFDDYLAKLASEIQSYPALLGYDLINEPIYQGMYKDGAGVALSKHAICGYVTQWVDAIRQNDQHHLVTIGSATLDELNYFDPGILKLDFYSVHIYPKALQYWNYSIQLGFDLYQSIVYWLSQAYPIPWIMGETGFAADDNGVNPTAHPAILDNLPAHHSPPWMYGSEQQQADFAQFSLDVTRNAGGSGYAWWAFQNVYWFDLNSLPNQYSENFYGLLHYDDDNNTNDLDDKPASSIFENYFTSGQPPPVVPLQEPADYYDPYHSQAYSALYYGGHSVDPVTGTVTDPNGQPVKNAVIRAQVFTGQKGTNPDGSEYPKDNLYYTFTQSDGSYSITPFEPVTHDVNRQYIRRISATAAGCSIENENDYGWVGGPQGTYLYYVSSDYSSPPQIPNPCDFNVGSGKPLRRLNNIEDDKVIQNQTINSSNSTATYTGRLTLTASGTNEVQSGGVADFHALNEVHITGDFHAAAGSEVHIYNAPLYADCDNDFPNPAFRLASHSSGIINQTRTSSLELQFIKEEDALTIIPNPNGGIFTIKFIGNESAPMQLNCFDLLGNNILSKTIPESSAVLNLSVFPKGMYYLQASDGSRIINKKLLIQ